MISLLYEFKVNADVRTVSQNKKLMVLEQYLRLTSGLHTHISIYTQTNVQTYTQGRIYIENTYNFL